MSIEGPEDLAGLERVGAAVAEARDAMLAEAAPGVTTAELDEVARDVLRKHGARSAPQLAYQFPGWTCVSVNDRLAHGIPSKACRLREGDLVNCDVSAELDGYWADTGASREVGTETPRSQKLLRATREALERGMDSARASTPLRLVGRSVESVARKYGFRIVRNLGGHGVGRFIHEEPHVNNHFEPRDRTVLHEGLVITIEPFLTTRATHVIQDADGWTLRTPDGSLGAQFEHTIVITNAAPIVIT